MSLYKVATTIVVFIIAFYLSMMVNYWVYVWFQGSVADYINNSINAILVIFILYGTGFIDAIHRNK